MADQLEECSNVQYKFTEVLHIFFEKVAKEHPLRQLA